MSRQVTKPGKADFHKSFFNKKKRLRGEGKSPCPKRSRLQKRVPNLTCLIRESRCYGIGQDYRDPAEQAVLQEPCP